MKRYLLLCWQRLRRRSYIGRRATASDSAPIENQAGPPDLDEIFRDLKRKMDNLFGALPNQKKDVSGDGKPPNSPFPSLPFTIIGGIAIFIMLVFWLASGFYVVDSNERAVVMQFGRYTKVSTPGLNWRLPYPFQSHEIVVFSSVRTFEVGINRNASAVPGIQMLTGDENILLVHYTVQYDVADAPNYVYNDVMPDATVRLVAETAMRAVVGSSTLDKVLYEDREEVARSAREIMQGMLDRYAVGIRVIRLNLQSVRPPAKVQAAFDDAIKASQDRQRQVNEGEAYSQNVVPRAKGHASRVLEEAQGYKESIIARAKGETSRFSQIYNQYKLAKEVTRERIYLDTMSSILSRSQKVIIDPQSRSFINLSTPSSPLNAKVLADTFTGNQSTNTATNTLTQNNSQQNYLDRLTNRYSASR